MKKREKLKNFLSGFYFSKTSVDIDIKNYNQNKIIYFVKVCFNKVKQTITIVVVTVVIFCGKPQQVNAISTPFPTQKVVLEKLISNVEQHKKISEIAPPPFNWQNR